MSFGLFAFTIYDAKERRLGLKFNAGLSYGTKEPNTITRRKPGTFQLVDVSGPTWMGFKNGIAHTFYDLISTHIAVAKHPNLQLLLKAGWPDHSKYSTASAARHQEYKDTLSTPRGAHLNLT